MPGPSKTTAQPSLRDLLDLHTREIMLALNCHAVATVQAFDPDTQRIQATINYSREYSEKNSMGEYVPVLRSYPMLADLPAIVLGGAGANLTFPIATGDQCLVFFNDRDMDNWIAGAFTGAPATARLHSFADGIALVGLNKVSDYDADRVVLRNGTAKIGLGESLIQFQNDVRSLKGLLSDLITAIKAISVSPGTFTAGATPVTGAGSISSGSQTALDTVNTHIGELLE